MNKNKSVQKKIAKKLIFFLVLFGLLFLVRWVLAADFGTEAVNSGLNGTLASGDPREIVSRVINIALGLLGVIALALVIYGGFIWMTSNGEEEKITQAKRILKNGIIGLAIILAAWAIATFIITRLAGSIGGGSSLCVNGETSSCGCGGYMTCNDNIWGACIGSDCGGIGPTSCDSSPNPGCQASESICASQDYCDGNDCSCRPKGNLGDPCDSDPDTPSCEADSARCAEYLSCDEATCTCFGPPVITGVSPLGGFCQEDNNKSCSQDSDCETTCDVDIPNGAPNNFITIFGKNFGEYSPTDSKVVFLGLNDPRDGLNPTQINSECIDTWQDDQIVIAIPGGVSSGAIKVVNQDALEDRTDDEYGPNIPDFISNAIVRPGLCSLDPNQGFLSSPIAYQGINLYASDAYFGNYDSNVRALDSNFNNPAGLSGTSITPNIRSGDSGSFVINNINGSEEKSNFLYFNKAPEEGEGPYIMSFSPSFGAPGQYVSIKGSGFGGAQGANRVYFDNTEASYNFPPICANSIWSDKQIVVKVPEGIGNGDYVIRVVLGGDIIDTQGINPNTFEVDSEAELKTSLCRIEPKLGPTASVTTVYGEYFGALGTTGTVKFNPESSPKTYGEIKEENEASLISVEVPEGAVTGPVKVIKNGVWGNELNFEVGECSIDSDCGTQICCPQSTYKEGRCMDSLEDCFVDIPTSVFEWSFNTGFEDSGGGSFDSCAVMASYYGSCQEGSFCPNAPGVCSLNPGGAKQIVANCDYSCNTVSGCGNILASTCNYDTNTNKCVQSGDSGLCDLPQAFSYNLGGETYQADKNCNPDGYWEITTPVSCPEGWTRYENNRCVDENTSCSSCSGDLNCELLNSEARCTSSEICPAGSTCEDNPNLNEPDNCTITEDSSCSCCCRIEESEADCCAPLECAGTCGGDTVDDNAGYGLCTGCAFVGDTQEEHDSACNCTGRSGQYCDITTENPAGVCVDCSGLAGKNSCDDHSSVCCFDSNRSSDGSDDYCRGGSGAEISNDPNNADFGYCPYYDCYSDSVPPVGDPTECASSNPKKIGYFKDIASCETGCSSGSGGDYCSTFNGQPDACMAENSCCFDQDTSECLGGARIESGNYEGYCAYYNCQDPTTEPPGDPTKCDLTPVTSGEFTSSDACSIGCASSDGGVGQPCTYFGSVEDSCAVEVCSYPGFACLNEEGDLGSYPSCGTCCCDPSQPESCQTAEAPNLYCTPDKGSCSGSNRGLCCGCTSDEECGNQATVGCGAESCCQARPNVLTTLPENAAENICRNAVVRVSFDQPMDLTSFNRNVVLFEERNYGNGVCPTGTFVAKGLGEEKVQPQKTRLSRFIASIRKIFVRLDKEVLADEPSPSKLYCSVPGVVSEEKIGPNSTLVFSPSHLLAPETAYYLVVKGDEDLNSQSGVISVAGIGFNGLGFEQGESYKEGSLITFNGQSYKNSHITEFTTLSDQESMNGICAIDKVVVSPVSYLFNKLDNDLNENDTPGSSTFDTKSDRDKVFTAWAYSADGQIIHPVSGYYWDWNWNTDVSIVSLSGSANLDNNKVFATINDSLMDSETQLWANVNMDRFLDSSCSADASCICQEDDCSNSCCNAYSAGDGLSAKSDLYIFICDNPWPPVNNLGNWYPWADNCDGAIGPCSDFNYKFYYCRDAGAEGTLDDLPAIINQAVIRGQGNSLICSADKNPCDTLGSACGPDRDGDGAEDGVCIWNVLKESYFFREEVLPLGELIDVVDRKVGGELEIFWRSGSEQVAAYKIYYGKQDSSDLSVKEVSRGNACQMGEATADCHTVISGLNNDQVYGVKFSIISVNRTESRLSKEKFGTPTDQTPPAIPNNFKAGEITTDNNILTFSWDTNTDDALFYRLYRGINSGQYGESFDSDNYGTSLTFSLDQFSPGNNYFALSAVDASGNESQKTTEIQINISE